MGLLTNVHITGGAHPVPYSCTAAELERHPSCPVDSEL